MCAISIDDISYLSGYVVEHQSQSVRIRRRVALGSKTGRRCLRHIACPSPTDPVASREALSRTQRDAVLLGFVDLLMAARQLTPERSKPARRAIHQPVKVLIETARTVPHARENERCGFK